MTRGQPAWGVAGGDGRSPRMAPMATLGDGEVTRALQLSDMAQTKGAAGNPTTIGGAAAVRTARARVLGRKLRPPLRAGAGEGTAVIA